MTGVLDTEYRVLPTGGYAVGYWTAHCKKCTFRATKNGKSVDALVELIEKHIEEEHGSP